MYFHRLGNEIPAETQDSEAMMPAMHPRKFLRFICSVIITPDISFHSKQISSFNAKYNAKIIGEHDFGQYGVVYKLEIPWNSPLNALKLSNIYHESDLVIYGSPNFGGGGKPH